MFVLSFRSFWIHAFWSSFYFIIMFINIIIVSGGTVFWQGTPKNRSPLPNVHFAELSTSLRCNVSHPIQMAWPLVKYHGKHLNKINTPLRVSFSTNRIWLVSYYCVTWQCGIYMFCYTGQSFAYLDYNL